MSSLPSHTGSGKLLLPQVIVGLANPPIFSNFALGSGLVNPSAACLSVAM
jgi:hypothetical protein